MVVPSATSIVIPSMVTFAISFAFSCWPLAVS
jgi:hypothetical protein